MRPMPKPLKFYPVRLAGTRSYADAVGQAVAGDPVTLLRELGNPHDADAIAVVDGDARTLGYVPRDNWLRGALVDEGKSATASIEAAPDGGVTISVALIDGEPIGWRDFAPAD